MPLLTPELEPHVYGLLTGEARRLRCELLAIGGIADHVHLALLQSPVLSISRLVQQLKGVSSTRVRNEVARGATFGWQDNYAAFSFSSSHRDRVVAYIRGQKQHHSSGTVWQAWEPDAPPPGA